MSRTGETTIANAELDQLAQLLTRTVASAALVWTECEEPCVMEVMQEAAFALRTVEQMGGQTHR